MIGYRKFIVTLYGMLAIAGLAGIDKLSPVAASAIAGMVAGYMALNMLNPKSKLV